MRPAVVISTAGYIRTVRGLLVVVPVTTTDRRWPHHVRLRGFDLQLTETSFAMTEQPRAISTARITRTAGSVDQHTLDEIRQWVADFMVIES